MQHHRRASTSQLVAGAMSAGRVAVAGLDAADLGDVDVVHDARVAVRCLRSQLRSLRPWLDRAPVEALTGELGDLGAELGRVRDVDVIEELLEDVAIRSGRIGVAELFVLLAPMERARAVACAALAEPVARDRRAELVAALAAAESAPPLGPDVDPAGRAAPVARRAARRSWKRVRPLLEAAVHRDLTDDELHRLRRRAKAARYAAELAAPVVAGSDPAFAREMRRVQGSLGAVQDAATAMAWLRAGATGDAEVAFVAGQLWVLVDARRAAARARFSPADHLRRAERAASWF